MRARTSIGLVLLLSLCGCKLGPNYKRPALDVPGQYRGTAPDLPQQPAGGPFGEMKWSDVYRNDATLMAALANHGAEPPVLLASAALRPPVVEDATPKAPAVTGQTFGVRDPSYPSTDELRARFHASLERRREALAQASDARADIGAVPAPVPQARSGRFTYAPYGS